MSTYFRRVRLLILLCMCILQDPIRYYFTSKIRDVDEGKASFLRKTLQIHYQAFTTTVLATVSPSLCCLSDLQINTAPMM